MDGQEIKHLDDIFNLLGHPGRFQVIQFVVLAFQYIHMSVNDFIPIFYGLAPSQVRCKDDVAYSILHPDNLQAAARPTSYLSANMSHAVCHCPRGFEYVYPGKQWSIIADMDLICDKAPLVNLATTVYFMGQMVSTAFFGWGADKFGRRPILLISNLCYTILSTSLIFSRDYVSFVLLRFFTGIAIQGMNSSFYVLLMEWIPPKRRGTWGAIAELMYTAGVLAVALSAYLLQNWHYLQIFLASLNIISVLLYWFAPESLTWLYMNNRCKEALSNIQSVAKFNGIHISAEVTQQMRRYIDGHPGRGKGSSAYSVIDCFRTPNVRRTTLLCCFSWLSCYFGYLGLSYLSSDIASDVYLNLAINGGLELIPIFLATAIASRFGNKVPLLTYFLVGGVTSLVAGMIPRTNHVQLIVQNVLAFVGRMAFVGTQCVIFVFTSELFPTAIRNNGFSLCSTSLRIGSMVTPLLPLMSERTPFKGSGFLLVGLVAIMSAGATSLLRETKGKPLPDTTEEAEALGQHTTIFGRLARSRQLRKRDSNAMDIAQITPRESLNKA